MTGSARSVNSRSCITHKWQKGIAKIVLSSAGSFNITKTVWLSPKPHLLFVAHTMTIARSIHTAWSLHGSSVSGAHAKAILE